MNTVLLTPPLSQQQRMGVLAEGGAIMPGLGVLYLAAALRKTGMPVDIIDGEGLGYGVDETVRAIRDKKPRILGISATTVSIMSAVEVARCVKRAIPDVLVILGGPHVTALPMETMACFPMIDGCIIGDGETSFTRLVKNIDQGAELSSGVDGLVYRVEDRIKVNPKRSHLENIDTLPFPAWDMLDGFPKHYRPPFHSYRRLPLANIITTRGCPYQCSFCDRSVFGHRVMAHSVDYVIDMIGYLKSRFGIREISIKDDMFIITKSRVVEFCRKLNEKRMDILWSCNARVNNISNDILREMKMAGCWMISYGIESGSPEMLKKMQKNITKKQVVEALRLTHKNGIVSKGFFMIGIPGETRETLQETEKFVHQIALDELNINFFTPFPGSRLYQEVLDEGFKPDFQRMNMLDTVYVPKGLDEKDLKAVQKKIIISFYAKISKVKTYFFRALQNADEMKRLMRMVKMFFALVLGYKVGARQNPMNNHNFSESKRCVEWLIKK